MTVSARVAQKSGVVSSRPRRTSVVEAVGRYVRLTAPESAAASHAARNPRMPSRPSARVLVRLVRIIRFTR
jgi:hypothetical protein